MAEIVSVQLIIGMEVHVELACATKAFSRSPSVAAVGGETDAAPNTFIDPVVLGLPGALPMLNQAAVEMSIRVGLALGCSIAPVTRWDRKSYFYADMPKGYQISQYDRPICFDGALDIPAPANEQRGGSVAADYDAPMKRIGIIRAHLEEDAGKLLHEAPGGSAIDHSIVDLNRAGTALLEIVTQPDLRSAEEAVLFCQTLRDICRALGVTRGVLQKGHMRFEPNVNCILALADGRTVKTPIVEVKNLNSFKSVRGAIEHEAREQPARWRADGREMGRGTKQTRGWDDTQGVTYVMREKEDAHDYRYFPDPDLLPVTIDEWFVKQQRDALPEMPLAKLRRFTKDFDLGVKEAAALTSEPADCVFFESIVSIASAHGVPTSRAGKAAANLMLQSGLKRVNELGSFLGTPAVPAGTSGGADLRAASSGDDAVLVSTLGITPAACAGIVILRDEGSISAQAADELFGNLCSPSPRDGVGGGLFSSPESQVCARSLPNKPTPRPLPRGGGEEDAAGTIAAVRAEATRRGMIRVRDDAALDAWAAAAINANPQAAADVRAGKEAAVGRIVGAAMKLAGGKGDAGELRKRIIEKLRGS